MLTTEVAEAPGVGANFLPSKLLPALATGTPVLAVCEETSPLACEVKAGRFGEVVLPNDPKHLREFLKEWLRKPELLKQFSENARQRARLYRRESMLSRYKDELALLYHTAD